MIDREKVLAVLSKRFPGATPGQTAAAANAIVGLTDEWEDVTAREPEICYHCSLENDPECYVAGQVRRGAEVRIFLRRPPEN